MLTLPAPAPPPTRTIPSQHATHLNMILQQLPGMGPVQAAQMLDAAARGGNVEARAAAAVGAVEIRQIRLQMFVIPLFMLLLRTGLLLYFVAPARKPIFAVLILAWVLYEIWQPIRNALRNAQGAADQRQEPNVGGGEGRPGVLLNRDEQGNLRPPGAQAANSALAMFESLGNIHTATEEHALNGRDVPEPTWKEKAYVFASLLVTSAHPGMWNRRRTTLRERESRIRADASIREEVPNSGEEQQTPENEARTRRRAELLEQHAQRPAWVQAYIHRVVSGNWADDVD